MSFLNHVGADALVDDGFSNEKLPLGVHVADVQQVRPNEEKEIVGVFVKFREFGVNQWFNLGFRGGTPEKTLVAKRMAVKQLRNAGNTIKTDADIAPAVDNLNGAALKIRVSTNKNNPQYQNFFIEGNVPRLRDSGPASVVDDNVGDTDDLPF